MFKMTSKPIEIQKLRQSLSHSSAGAMICFEGLVRDQNEGKQVVNLEYQAYQELAENEGAKILQEAMEKFSLVEAHCFHRTGMLQIGEPAVWVACLSRHRGEGFEGCRYIIDELKKRVPIWKKEYYTDGNTGWIGIDEGCHCGDK